VSKTGDLWRHRSTQVPDKPLKSQVKIAYGESLRIIFLETVDVGLGGCEPPAITKISCTSIERRSRASRQLVAGASR
jgi:hypothetical protein